MSMRNWLYQLLINKITNECYRNCLDYFPNGSTILDVGIGNGIMIKTFHSLIKSKTLRITGIDIDDDYLKHCRELISKYQLDDYVEIYQGSVESYDPVKTKCFDFVLFSMSFMLLNDQHLILDRIRDWLKPGGEIVFVQTMYKDRSRLMDIIKPRLKYLTTIDFGKATYERDFFALLNENGLAVREDIVVREEWFDSQCRMIVASAQTEK